MVEKFCISNRQYYSLKHGEYLPKFETLVNNLEENKVNEGEEDFPRPSADDVRKYCNEIGIMIDCEKFVNHYNSKGWQINGSPLIDWKSRVKAWYREDIEKKRAAPVNTPKPPKGVFNNYNQRVYSHDEVEEILRRKREKME